MVPIQGSSPSRRSLALAAGLFGLVALLPTAALGQSALLDSVKQNPARAKALCAQLRQLNSQGISSTSRQAIALVAAQQNLSSMDAEVLTTYVVGLHCPDVK